MDVEKEQPAAAAPDTNDNMNIAEDNIDMSYIERLVYEVENDGEEDDISLDLDINEDGDDEEDMEEDGVVAERINEEGAENGNENESSDEALEYDSDDDITVRIMHKCDHPSSSSSDSDRGELSEAGKTLLIWRLDKEDSFSDWSIEVIVTKRGKDSKTLYHVHRSSLAIGPRKSGYFEALFKSDHFKESSNSASEVRLSEDDAASFPHFLDFLYCSPNEGQCLIRRDNWHSLHHLANYFIVPKLSEAIVDFVEGDMHDMHDIGRLEKYLQDYSGCYDTTPKYQFLLVLITNACAKMILSIERDSSLLFALSPAMLLQIITMLRSSKNIKDDDLSHICSLVASYIINHQSNLNGNYFNALSGVMCFPHDVSTAGRLAIDLLEVINEMGWTNNAVECFCIATLSQYLAADEGPDFDEIEQITSKISAKASSLLLSEALFAKRTLKARKINNVACKIMTSWLELPSGNAISISCNSNDSINHIRYLICSRLSLVRSFTEIEIYHKGRLLDNEKTVSKCGISSNATLEIKSRWPEG